MTPKAIAAVGLRILGVWFILDGAASWISNLFLLNNPFFEGMMGTHRRFYDGGGTGVSISADFYWRDIYYLITHSVPSLAGIIMPLVIGVILLLASKPLAKIVARGLETF